MDATLRDCERGLDLNDPHSVARYIILRQRAGLTIGDNLTRIFTSIGFEPMVLAVGGAPKPSYGVVFKNPAIWSYKPTRDGRPAMWLPWMMGFGSELRRRIFKNKTAGVLWMAHGFERYNVRLTIESQLDAYGWKLFNKVFQR